jgi:hypothetical protein
VAEHRTELTIDFGIGLKPLHRANIAGEPCRKMQ